MCTLSLSLSQLSQQHHDLQSKEAAVTAYEKQLERTQGQLMADIGEKDDMIFKMRSEVHKIQVSGRGHYDDM